MVLHLCLQTCGTVVRSRLVDLGSQWAIEPRDYYYEEKGTEERENINNLYINKHINKNIMKKKRKGNTSELVDAGSNWNEREAS